VLEVLHHHAKFGGAWISPAAGAAKNAEFFLSVCLSVCPSVSHTSECQSLCARFCHEDVAVQNDFDTHKKSPDKIGKSG